MCVLMSRIVVVSTVIYRTHRVSYGVFSAGGCLRNNGQGRIPGRREDLKSNDVVESPFLSHERLLAGSLLS